MDKSSRRLEIRTSTEPEFIEFHMICDGSTTKRKVGDRIVKEETWICNHCESRLPNEFVNCHNYGAN